MIMPPDPHNSGEHAKVEARRWKAVTLANRGLTHRMIAEQMADEYRETNPNLTIEAIANHVGVDIHRALKTYQKRNDLAVEERITAQALRLNEIRRRLYSIIVEPHYVLYQGEIVRDEDGRPLQDRGPVLAAINQLRALEDQQARLEGTYQREKLDIALSRRVEDEAADVVEAILAGFSALPDLDPALRQRALEAAGAHLRSLEAGDGDDGIPDAEIVE
jgi:hypothetical protein